MALEEFWNFMFDWRKKIWVMWISLWTLYDFASRARRIYFIILKCFCQFPSALIRFLGFIKKTTNPNGKERLYLKGLLQGGKGTIGMLWGGCCITKSTVTMRYTVFQELGKKGISFIRGVKNWVWESGMKEWLIEQ